MKLIEFEASLKKLTVINCVNLIPDFEEKLSDDKWSKKEIIGHLIDSAINNIQRFTEIQYFKKPYFIRPYKQNELVLFNDYQNQNNQNLFDLWIQLNNHILHIIKNQTAETLKFKIILSNGEKSNLQFLIEDYLEHFHHHLQQVHPEQN